MTVRTEPTPQEMSVVNAHPHLAFGWCLITPGLVKYDFPELDRPVRLHDGNFAHNIVATAQDVQIAFGRTINPAPLLAQYLLRDGAGQVPAYPTVECGDHPPMAKSTVPCARLSV